MITHKFRKAATLFLVAVMALTAFPLSVLAAPGEAAKIAIIHVNDRHGRTDAEPYISQMAKDMKAEGINVLILDAGDSLHGQTPANLSKGEVMVEIMNEVGYGAMAPGNHDFNFGVDRLTELSKKMKFPVLAANVKTKNGENLFESYKVFEIDGVKVGIFGLATPETVSKSDPRIVEGLEFSDPSESAKEMVELLKGEGCDIIAALTHLGVDNASKPEDRSDALAKIEGIDIIIDGHSHTLLENGKNVNGTLICQTGSFAENIGIIKITVNDGGKSISAKTIAVPTGEEETELIRDEIIVEKIAELDKKIEPITSAIIGKTPVLLQGEREFVRTVETNLANLITDSMMYATGADIAFLTGGNIRASIEAGDITMGQALTTLPFSNLLATVDLSGAEMLEALEHGVAKYPEVAGEYIQVSGIKFEFDPNAEPMSRVTKVVMADGSDFDNNKIYTVCTIDFITAGGDGYTVMEKAKNKTYYQGDVEAFAEYLGTNPAINSEPEGRVTPVVKTEAPAIRTEPNLVPVPQAEPDKNTITQAEQNVYVVKPGDNLTRIANAYGTTWREIYKLNTKTISDPNIIYPGQKINVPYLLPDAS